MGSPRWRDACAEAQTALNDSSLRVHVLEPSPPAIQSDPYADDPAVPHDIERAVTPTTAGALSWSEVVSHRDDLADFAAERWLGAWRPLPSLPRDFVDARNDLHVLAFYVVSAARRRANGRIGLRWTLGGFGTPFFGDDVQVRLDGDALVVQSRNGARSEPLSTLRGAGELLRAAPNAADRGEFDAPDVPDVDAPLRVHADHVGFVGAWFGFAASVLEQLRVDGATLEPGLVQLWPEHFDLATELGDAAAGRRATFGASPGDAAHPEPYLYVAAWQSVDRTIGYWNDGAFNGASLPLDELSSAPDQRQAALDFFHEGLAIVSRRRDPRR